MITDTDHYAPGEADALWAWKSFLRGHHPILMGFGIIDGVNLTEPTPAYKAFEPARYAMGDTLRCAQKMKLIDMEPRDELSSTGYALVNPGEEYLVLQPSESAETFSVSLAAGNYAVEWYCLNSRETVSPQAGKTHRRCGFRCEGSPRSAQPLDCRLPDRTDHSLICSMGHGF